MTTYYLYGDLETPFLAYNCPIMIEPDGRAVINSTTASAMIFIPGDNINTNVEYFHIQGNNGKYARYDPNFGLVFDSKTIGSDNLFITDGRTLTNLNRDIVVIRLPNSQFSFTNFIFSNQPPDRQAMYGFLSTRWQNKDRGAYIENKILSFQDYPIQASEVILFNLGPTLAVGLNLNSGIFWAFDPVTRLFGNATANLTLEFNTPSSILVKPTSISQLLIIGQNDTAVLPDGQTILIANPDNTATSDYSVVLSPKPIPPEPEPEPEPEPQPEPEPETSNNVLMYIGITIAVIIGLILLIIIFRYVYMKYKNYRLQQQQKSSWSGFNI